MWVLGEVGSRLGSTQIVRNDIDETIFKTPFVSLHASGTNECCTSALHVSIKMYHILIFPTNIGGGHSASMLLCCRHVLTHTQAANLPLDTMFQVNVAQTHVGQLELFKVLLLSVPRGRPRLGSGVDFGMPITEGSDSTTDVSANSLSHNSLISINLHRAFCHGAGRAIGAGGGI